MKFCHPNFIYILWQLLEFFHPLSSNQTPVIEPITKINPRIIIFEDKLELKYINTRTDMLHFNNEHKRTYRKVLALMHARMKWDALDILSLNLDEKNSR
jgi:hypothetical protein